MRRLELRDNPNYCATVVKIENLHPLEGCQNIQGTMILGNHVIVSNDTVVGQVGIFFPVETAINRKFISENNLFRDKTLNVNTEKTGFFEVKGRVRCVKLRGHRSEGLFMPLDSLLCMVKEGSLEFPIGTDFDYIDGQELCKKYVVHVQKTGTPGAAGSKLERKLKKISKLVDGQFRFHIDTAQLVKNSHRLTADALISITDKWHGTSAVAAYIECKRQLSWKDKFARMIGAFVKETEYDLIWASRKVIKNKYVTNKAHQHFYSEDIWKIGADELKPHLDKGMTVYYEIVGYLSTGKQIQSGYDYGCESGQHKLAVYRITTTNTDGKVFEWPMQQVQSWCGIHGIPAVPLLFMGRAEDLYHKLVMKHFESDMPLNFDPDAFVRMLSAEYLEKRCSYCKNKVPAEGIVLRIEGLDIESYKLKSSAFREYETKMLDIGEENIEDSQGE